jgi:type VII secretion protein EccE
MSFPWPGPGRITLVLLAVVPAVMAHPWSSSRDRWLLGVAVAVLIVLLGWWRGLLFTTILRRGAAMLRHRRAVQTGRRCPDVRTTALLRVLPSAADPGVLPLPLIAGYLNRYGLRADTIRVTSRDTCSETDEPQRDTWIGLTLSAAENLPVLQARSPQIPLQETAEVAARRLADHLREAGWEAAPAGPDDIPQLFTSSARETWHGVWEGTAGYVAAYRISVDHTLNDTLAQIWGYGAWAYGAQETWTAVEIAGTPDRRTVAAGCALRTDERPAGAGPLPGLIGQHGNHRPALWALHPLSGQHLDGHTELSADDIAALHWPTAPDSSAGLRSRSHARHRPLPEHDLDKKGLPTGW